MISRNIAFDLCPYSSKEVNELQSTANASSVSLEMNGNQNSFQEIDDFPNVSGTTANCESTNLSQLQVMSGEVSQGNGECKSVAIGAVETDTTSVTEKSTPAGTAATSEISNLSQLQVMTEESSQVNDERKSVDTGDVETAAI